MASDKEERIRTRAPQIWERDGRPNGLDREHWAQAERELDGEGADDASANATPAPERGASARAQSSGPGGTAGIASGLQPGGVRPGGGPSGIQGSVGTGGGSTAGRPSGSTAERSR